MGIRLQSNEVVSAWNELKIDGVANCLQIRVFKLVLELVFLSLFNLASWQCLRFEIVLYHSLLEELGELLDILDNLPVVLDIGLQGVLGLLFEVLDGLHQLDLLSRKLESVGD